MRLESHFRMGWRTSSAPAPRRTARLVILIFVAVLLAGATGAWACVPQPLITITPMASGPPGTELTVNGYAVTGKAEIRWNALDGPLLASADGPVFSVPVTVPPVEDGLYTVLMLERDQTGALGSTGRAAFQVTSGSPGLRDSNEAVTSTTIAPPVPSSSSSSVPAGAALIGGAGLLALGGVAGALAARRRGGGSGERSSVQP